MIFHLESTSGWRDTQQISHLLQREDWSSDTQDNTKGQVGECVSSPIIPALGKFSDRRNLWASWLDRLVKSVSLGPSEKVCLRKDSGEQLRCLPDVNLWTPYAATCMQMYIWTRRHTHENEHMHTHTCKCASEHTDAHIWTWNHTHTHTLQTRTYPNIQRKKKSHQGGVPQW